MSLPCDTAASGQTCRTKCRAPASRRWRVAGPLWFVSLATLVVLMAGCRQDSGTAPAARVPVGSDSRVSAALDDRGSAPAETFHERLGISMVLIRAGAFEMGSAEPERFGNYSRCEGPLHPVELTRDFSISRTEITVGMFRRFVTAARYRTEAEQSGLGVNGLDPHTGQVSRRAEWIWSSPGFEQTDNHPVVCVSWQDAQQFCRWLSLETGCLFRLPTEAEWEYCCRAGTQTLFSSGDDIPSLQNTANCGDRHLAARSRGITNPADWDDGFAFTAPVGSFAANSFGLHDMHGNVGEWCQDWFAADYYGQSPRQDPSGPRQAEAWHAVRGGSWYNNPLSCRSAGRHDGIPTAASTTNGFRVVLE